MIIQAVSPELMVGVIATADCASSRVTDAAMNAKSISIYFFILVALSCGEIK